MKEYEPIIQEAARQYGIDPELIRRMIRQESAGNPGARSNKGASGLMQLMPDTARELGVRNILDPKENIMAGTKYMRQMLDKYGNDIPKALAAYNAGPGNVDRHGGIPPFRETQDYVSRITSGYNQPFPEGTPSRVEAAPMANPVAQTLPAQQTGPMMNRFKVTDPKTGRQYIMSGESEPTDEEIESHIAQFEQENPQVPEKDEFKEGVLEQSQAAQFVQNPMPFIKGIGQAIVQDGDPLKMIARMIIEEGKAAANRVNTELDHVAANDKGDNLSRFAGAAGAAFSAIPVFGELVRPMRESIPQNPHEPINWARVGGNVVGAGVDAALARFIPPAAGAAVNATGRGMTSVGSALSKNATNRLANNARLGPVTGAELANDVLRGNATFGAVPDHAVEHQNGGGDEISVAGLSGLLADEQTPLTHNILTKHNGFPGGGTTFLRDDGVFAVVPGGAATVAFGEFEQTIAPMAHSGRFTQFIVVPHSVGKPVHVFQKQGPYTSKGTRADEAEMDHINITGYVKSTDGATFSVLEFFWESRYKVRGNYKFAYLVGA